MGQFISAETRFQRYSTPDPHIQGKAAAALGRGSLALAENV